MSVVTVQIGQCGNQLGSAFFSALADELLPLDSTPNSGSEAFFWQNAAGEYKPRALLLDMEPKVVQACLRRKGRTTQSWSYCARNAVVQQSGSGTCPPFTGAM